MVAMYYGRVSTPEQNEQTQADAAAVAGVLAGDVHIDKGMSGYHTTPAERPEWQKVNLKLRRGDVLVVRWLDRISRRYEELHRVMQELMGRGVVVRCTLNGMEFDGSTTDPIKKAVRDSLLAFMAAQGEVDYANRREMQAAGIAVAKAEGRMGRPQKVNPLEMQEWRTQNNASLQQVVEHFGVSKATAARHTKAAG